MPDATITSTASTFGTISGVFTADQSTIAGTILSGVVGTLSGSVGVPGPQGQQGGQGPKGDTGEGVPTGGSTGQYLVKQSGTSYDTVWQTLSLAGYATESWVTSQGYITSSALAPYLTTSTAAATYLPKTGGYITGDIQSLNGSQFRTFSGSSSTIIYPYQITLNNGSGSLTIDAGGLTFASSPYKQTQPFLGLSGYATEAWTTAHFYPLSSNPAGYLTSAALSGYATESWVTAGFAPIAAGVPTSGTVGQVLTKNSGTAYDASWQTLIPGDRYLTTSTTTLTVGNGTKSLTVGTGLSYSPQQDVVIAYDGTAHMHAVVTSYDSGTGAMVVNVQNHTGSGTYSEWTVNVGGTVPQQSVLWGDILGTLGDQSDLATALNAKLEVTDAAATYYPLSNPAGYIDASALSGYATESWVGSQGYLTDAPSDGNIYGRRDGGWAVAGGGGFIPGSGDLDLGGYSILNTWGIETSASGGTNEKTTIGYSSVILSGGIYKINTEITNNRVSLVDYNVYPAILLELTTSGIRFPDASNQTTAWIDAPSDGNQYARKDGAWDVVSSGSSYITSVSSPLSVTSGDLSIDLTGYATESWVTSQGFLTSGDLSGYATESWVSGQGYITSSALSGYATESWVTSQGYLTSAPVTSVAGRTGAITLSNTDISGLGTMATATATDYLSKAGNLSGLASTSTARTNLGLGTMATASTSDYSTTTVANGLYYPLSSNPAGYLTSAPVTSVAGRTGAITLAVADVSGAAPTASPTLTGTPLSTTAAADTNTTQIATTAFVVGQASSSSPAMAGSAAVGTSLKYARADHVHPSDTTKANLSSPAFTGVPTAPTAAVGTNTTQIATTAFVLANGGSPAFASVEDVFAATSTSNVLSPSLIPYLQGLPGYRIMYTLGFSSSSNGGGVRNDEISRVAYVQTTANSRGTWMSSTYTSNLNYVSLFSYVDANKIDFSKKIAFWGVVLNGASGNNFLGTSANYMRINLGGRSGNASGDLTQKGIGIYLNGGGAAQIYLTVHNGTTLTSVPSGVTPATNACFTYFIYSNGSGNVYLYINGVLRCQTSAGPTGLTTTYYNVYEEQAEGGNPSTNYSVSVSGSGIFIQP